MERLIPLPHMLVRYKATANTHVTLVMVETARASLALAQGNTTNVPVLLKLTN